MSSGIFTQQQSGKEITSTESSPNHGKKVDDAKRIGKNGDLVTAFDPLLFVDSIHKASFCTMVENWYRRQREDLPFAPPLGVFVCTMIEKWGSSGKYQNQVSILLDRRRDPSFLSAATQVQESLVRCSIQEIDLSVCMIIVEYAHAPNSFEVPIVYTNKPGGNPWKPSPYTVQGHSRGISWALRYARLDIRNEMVAVGRVASKPLVRISHLFDYNPFRMEQIEQKYDDSPHGSGRMNTFVGFRTDGKEVDIQNANQVVLQNVVVAIIELCYHGWPPGYALLRSRFLTSWWKYNHTTMWFAFVDIGSDTTRGVRYQCIQGRVGTVIPSFDNQNLFVSVNEATSDTDPPVYCLYSGMVNLVKVPLTAIDGVRLSSSAFDYTF